MVDNLDIPAPITVAILILVVWWVATLTRKK